MDPELDDFVNPDILEHAYNELVETVPETPLDTSRATDSLYEIICAAADATVFSKLLKQDPRLVSLFQDPSSGEHTVFLPIDSAWEASQQSIEDILSVHISPHYVTTEGLLHMPNVATILTPICSNGPQIVRTRFDSSGWNLNRTAHIVKGNIIAGNGVIHYTDHVLLPPPDILGVLELDDDLSTLRRAIRMTGLESEFTSADIKGRTLFAPTNLAFKALGEETLQFLFDTHAGVAYLKVLINLHFSPNVTFFSNLIWPKNNTGARQTSAEKPRRIKGRQSQTIFTRPLSGGAAAILVTLARFNGMISMVVNHRSKVILQDLAGSDGVVHVIDKVLLPDAIWAPTRGGKDWGLDDLKECLADYI